MLLRTGREATVGRSLSGTDRSAMYFEQHAPPGQLKKTASQAPLCFTKSLTENTGQVKSALSKRSRLLCFENEWRLWGNANFRQAHSRKLRRNATARINTRGVEVQAFRCRSIAELISLGCFVVCTVPGTWFSHSILGRRIR